MAYLKDLSLQLFFSTSNTSDLPNTSSKKYIYPDAFAIMTKNQQEPNHNWRNSTRRRSHAQ